MSRIPIVSTAAAALIVSGFAAPALGTVGAPAGVTAPGTVAVVGAGAVVKRQAVYSDPLWLPVREMSALHCTTVMRRGGCASGGHPALYIVPRNGKRFGGPKGPVPEPVYAAGYGIVHVGAKGLSCQPGQRTAARGNWVWIDHGKRQVTLYFHLDRVMVRDGQQVTPNTLLGPMGRTGKCKGTYLHYERRIGKAAGRPEKGLPPMANRACHGSTLVRYPGVFGVRSWSKVPYNSIIWSNGTGCA